MNKAQRGKLHRAINGISPQDCGRYRQAIVPTSQGWQDRPTREGRCRERTPDRISAQNPARLTQDRKYESRTDEQGSQFALFFAWGSPTPRRWSVISAAYPSSCPSVPLLRASSVRPV